MMKIIIFLLVTCGFVQNAFSATRSVSTRQVSRTAAPATAATKSVATRAATTQKVINTGTKVVAATAPSVSNEECQQKYFGCMDSLCMLDSANGGRCVCSDKNAQFDAILAEIQDLDKKTYELATVGVDSLLQGYDINAVYDRPESDVLDLSMWNQNSADAKNSDSLTNLTGSKLYSAAHNMCANSIPECAGNMNFLQILYNQQINNDCIAYENSLKQKRNESTEKLEAARLGLLDASYTALTNANQYDLGQCAVEFKKCMITTGGCGEDFSGCASVLAFDLTNTRGNTNTRHYVINGASTNIEISASTYDTLLSKKTLCDNITKNCQSVADQVWDTFLRESAPQIKNAELIAEDNARQDCIGTVSQCFQRACRDNIDPNDPSGSYDMCLTRPETMLSLCTVPLNACGIDSTSASTAEKSPIWEFVMARLASMRVNSCTTEFKECLQQPEMCGSDYTQCIGLDTDTIMRMCPYDKLVGCQQIYGPRAIRGNAVYDELYNVAQGIFLNVDNEMLDYCETALDEAIIRACGDTENCDKLTSDSLLGTRSLNYEICEIGFLDDGHQIGYTNCVANAGLVPDEKLGRVPNSTTEGLGPVTPLGGVIDGAIYWDGVKIDDDGNISTVDEYFVNIGIDNPSDSEYQMVNRELGQLQNNLDYIYNIIESDPTIQFCMTGRRVDGMKSFSGDGTNVARFPELTKSTRLKIANQGLRTAMINYYDRYDELSAQQARDYTTITERLAEIRGENGKDARRETARQACVDLATGSALPRAETPTSLIGTITVIVAIVAVAVVVTIFTAGAGAIAMGAGIAAGIEAGAAAGMGGALGGTLTTALATAGASIAVSGTATIAPVGILGAAFSAATTSLATSATVATVVGTVGAAGALAAAGAAATADYANPQSVDKSVELQGRYENEQWNYRETIVTTFNMDTLVCEKCVTRQMCNSTKSPFFGNYYCRSWDDAIEECTDIQF